MQTRYYPLNHISGLPKLLTDYLSGAKALGDLSEGQPHIESFKATLAAKQAFDPEKRKCLVDVLQKQYAGIENAPDIALLNQANTFTVTTGHQLNLFTGPLYVIYKIVSTINLARKLKAAYPDYHFVPVYWMASEDHDFEEINHFHLFDKKHSWETDQKGAVGRFTLDSLHGLLKSLPPNLSLFQTAYTDAGSLADAVRAYMHVLFGASGLISIDADDVDLKRQFTDVMRQDILAHAFTKTVEASTAGLEAAGYKAQINARPINFFYLVDGIRERIEEKNGQFQVLNQAISFTSDEIQDEIANHPERFSPNVVLRPLYQEVILPNLAYVGGPSEIGYWFQLKGVFDQHKTPFPILLPRNFGLIIPARVQAKMEKVGIKVPELFLDTKTITDNYVNAHTQHVLDLSPEQMKLSSLFEKLAQKALLVDETLEAAVFAEETRWQKGLEKLSKKMRKAEERNQETGLRQLAAIKTALFPSGNWQERHTNFLEFYLVHPGFIDILHASFDPLRFDLTVIFLDEANA